MQEVESQADFRRVESGVLLGQSSLSLHMEHKIATTHKFDDEKKARGRLETGMEADQYGNFNCPVLNPVAMLQLKSSRF